MQFDDQLGDFVEVADNTPAARAALLDEYGDWFGERWWMLPNPTYGGWEPALFDNDWALPRPARRENKREALDMQARHNNKLQNLISGIDRKSVGIGTKVAVRVRLGWARLI